MCLSFLDQLMFMLKAFYHFSRCLQNFDKLNVRTAHYTPIPAGYSPLKRPIQEYLKYVFLPVEHHHQITVIQTITWFKTKYVDFVKRILLKQVSDVKTFTRIHL